MKLRWLFPLAGLALACGQENSPRRVPPIEPLGSLSPTAQEGLQPEHGRIAEHTAARGPRRLSVSELERTWEVAIGAPPYSVQIPEALARTLGDPDYLSVTTPNLEPSPLFMKFMTDLGLILCGQLLEADQSRTEPERILLRSDVDAGLRDLVLRFWALERAPGDPELVRLRQAYDAATAGTGSPAGGWLAACLAVSTAPEFLLY